MKPRPKRNITYNRSIIVTVGLLCFLLPIVIWITDGDRSAHWPRYAWILFFSLPIAAIALFSYAWFASDKKIESSLYVPADGNDLLLMLFAAPIYALLKIMQEKRRREKPSRRKQSAIRIPQSHDPLRH